MAGGNEVPGKRFLACLLVVLVLVQPVFGQTSAAPNPEPYTDDEFSPFLKNLRRTEVIAIGIFPFAYLASSLLFDLGRFTYFSFAKPDLAPDYAPLFFAPPQKPPNSNEENTAILAVSIGLSLGLAILDRIIENNKAGEE